MDRKTNKKGKASSHKVITLGDPAVGKSCIVNRLIDQKYTSHHIATLGIDMKKKAFVVDDENVNL